MFRSFRDTDRSYGLRPRVGHGSTGSSPSGSPCPPLSSRRSRRAPLPRYGKWASGSSTVSRTVVRSQGPGASAPQPVGALGQLGKEQALPCADNLFSWCGVRLSGYDGAPHGRARPISAELPEFLQRQDCGSAETVSEAPGAYGIRSCSHAARIASYETNSALVALPSPEMGMAPRYTSGEHHTGVSPLLPPLDGPCFLRARVPLEQVSRHVVVTTDASSTGWGATCNGQAASGLWTGPRLLWHINCLELLAVHLALWQFGHCC